ncbi:iron ABC transporter ATP-binding protein [Candidatus Marsarchaeota G2 archaeon ECH_B_SAG-G16]|uniref:Iron ABC transporter ATP-binding protein n=5 Tax=Candidatus Marsarchaeota TaxID=1978152 RepID=A0A2R6AF80_9ARCH|nr:MAG: iron ABC transporter ATP-binding protein [Candidatus Marsarchaeota G1 archaeon OSP_D]PSN85041.1 MAG: iron ABC transporter ATP-binding protein [Candidatus Marsarchaeota G1 archaeon BE_D]PSN87680.1 MAG: iron ABC transporter ATP-binding protein [Candidatus Marsarchaeota G1 archaeon OSP_C]PSN90209.1 MAG: iron ABC transporter ATP-binding protein [Candidatus Marsarchaeota G1 archaeon OSP_B]PSO05900.1 MAG: iron ABC transporter ATP-binding protein [Candidatus Marsarchaeota G2 archaeon ECH_B_SAG
MLIKALSVKLNGKLILKEVRLELVKGLNVILGPNGSGKTTLLRSIIGMLKPEEGEIQVEGERSYAPAEFFGADMSVLDVLLSGGAKKHYQEYLEILGLSEFLNRNFSTLSTGEKRLILIAKALAEGDVVLMDEPTSGLDLKNQAKLKRVLLGLKSKTIVVCTHDINLALLADRVALLKNGRIIAQGEPKEVLTEALLSELYDVQVKKVWLDGHSFFFV